MNEDEGVTDPAQPNWSPAGNPHAIAISEAQWWQRAVELAALRLRDPDDQRVAWFSSRQIDARQLVFALRELLSAARLADVAMKARGVDTAARDALVACGLCISPGEDQRAQDYGDGRVDGEHSESAPG